MYISLILLRRNFILVRRREEEILKVLLKLTRLLLTPRKRQKRRKLRTRALRSKVNSYSNYFVFSDVPCNQKYGNVQVIEDLSDKVLYCA